MKPLTSVQLPEAFTSYLEANFYGKVTEQSMLEEIVNDQSFLADPLSHVALYSDHGIVHGRDIANKMIHVLHHVNGLLIPERQGSRLEFMLGYGVMVSYLHDIGMRDFSAFGRTMHPEFAAQLVYTPEFDPLINLLWQENSGNVAWRLSNFPGDGSWQQSPQCVLREMLALSIAHSKTKIPISILNDVRLLRETMQTRLSTNLHYLYYQQRVVKADQKLTQATQKGASTEILTRLAHELEQAKTQLSDWTETPDGQTTNPNLDRYYQDFLQESFQWLVSSKPEFQVLVLDVIDTLRSLRCADALRQRGQTFKTSAGYEVFVNQHTANAVYGLRSADGSKLFLLEGRDPISAGEANITGCDLDQAGNLRITFDRGSFSSPEAVEWAVHSAAVVINDIQADVVASFIRPVNPDPQLPIKKPACDMQILIEGVDDNPDFAAAVCEELSRINPALAHSCRAVASLQNADLAEVDRYLAAIEPAWSLEDQRSVLDQIAKSGQKIDHLDFNQAFREVRLITVKPGDVLLEANSPASFIYIPMSEGLKIFPLGGYQAVPAQAWVQIGNTSAIKGSVRNARVVAEQNTPLLVIPKQIYLQFWYNPYTTAEFVELFGGGNGSTLERRHLLMPVPVHKKLISKTRRQRYLPLALHLKTLFKDPSHVSPFVNYLEKLTIREGDRLFQQGEPANALYFVELGQISTFVELIGGQTQPVQVFESGKLVGEVDFYTQTVYQTTAISDRDSRLYQLTRPALQRMQQEHPQTAVAFSDMVLSLLANSLVESSKTNLASKSRFN